MTTAAQNQVKGKFITATITRREELTHEHWKAWLKPSEPFMFKPGQYCTIGTGGIERPYSIVSSPLEPELELFIELVQPPEGHLTPLLYNLQPGAVVSLRPRPKGIFVLQEQYKDHVLVATVTGVAPYVSMVRTYLRNPVGGHRFFILEGASFADEFGYDRELTALAAKHPDVVKFVATCSRPQDPRNVGWTGRIGRVNAIVEKCVEQWGLKPESSCVYACGNPQMIEDVKAKYEGKGFHFIEERFWKDD